MKPAGMLASLAVALTVAGCVLITGGTGGYTQDGGSEGGLFGDDGGLGCGAAADCDGGGQICCLVVDTTSATVIGSCQSGGACGSGLQLCTTNAECGDGGACMRQQCELGGAPTIFGLCGRVLTPQCAQVP